MDSKGNKLNRALDWEKHVDSKIQNFILVILYNFFMWIFFDFFGIWTHGLRISVWKTDKFVKFAYGGIGTADLWCWERPCCQVRHSHCLFRPMLIMLIWIENYNRAAWICSFACADFLVLWNLFCWLEDLIIAKTLSFSDTTQLNRLHLSGRCTNQCYH